MLVPVFLLFIWSANAYTPVCTNRTGTSMSFRPTEEGILGRYRVELCTERNPNVTYWTINLVYYDTPEYCLRNWTANPPRRALIPGNEHSTDTLKIEDTNNCTHVCYSMDLDLIFSSCYGIKSTIRINNIEMPPYDSFHMINNDITMDSIKSNKAHVVFVNHETQVSLTWYLGIPPSRYTVSMCQRKDATGAEIPGACSGELPDVTNNCTKDVRLQRLVCVFSPPYGEYKVMVQHVAPWIVGVFSAQEYSYYLFNHSSAAAPRVAGGASALVWWALGGALALAAAALAASAARRAMRRSALYKSIFANWPSPQRLGSVSEPPSPGVPELGARPVLLLYAREGERGEPLVQHLAQLLEQATGSPVYDIFSARVMALAGRAPHEWVRLALEQADVRVLLLQTPALAALYRDRLYVKDNALKLAEPLLGRRVVYRSPQFADGMLHYALRLVALNAHAHHLYHKYYIATLTDLPTDICEQVVPYTRYLLPHALTALLRDLSAAPVAAAAAAAAQLEPEPQLLQHFHTAVEQFVAHATENPKYLMDELLVIAKK